MADSNAFRCHHQVPADVTSPVLRALSTEWVALNGDAAAHAALRRWARTEPALAGLASPAAIVDAIDAADYETADALLLALVRLAQSRSQTAGRVLLQAILPGLATLAARARATTSDSAWYEDRIHIVIATAWEVIATFPADRRTHKIAANLVQSVRGRFLNSRSSRVTAIPVDDATLLTVAHPHPHIEDPLPGQLTADDTLLDVLSWARDAAVITRAEADLIARCYDTPQGRHGAYGFAEAAHDLDISPALARKRCSRAIRRLTQAARADLTGSRDPAAATA